VWFVNFHRSPNLDRLAESRYGAKNR
jgi:hypothetical protein